MPLRAYYKNQFQILRLLGNVDSGGALTEDRTTGPTLLGHLEVINTSEQARYSKMEHLPEFRLFCDLQVNWQADDLVQIVSSLRYGPNLIQDNDPGFDDPALLEWQLFSGTLEWLPDFAGREGVAKCISEAGDRWQLSTQARTTGVQGTRYIVNADFYIWGNNRVNRSIATKAPGTPFVDENLTGYRGVYSNLWLRRSVFVESLDSGDDWGLSFWPADQDGIVIENGTSVAGDIIYFNVVSIQEVERIVQTYEVVGIERYELGRDRHQEILLHRRE